MRVDSDPFPNVNVVNQASYSDEGGRSARRQLDFSFDVSMASPARRDDKKKEKANPSDRPQRGKKQYVTEDQVRGIRYQRPLSAHLLKKYEYQYRQRLQYESEGEEYQRRTGRILKRREDTRDHWHCPFFRYCWDSGMSRLPTIDNCPECTSHKRSVFERLGPRQEKAESSRNRTFEEEEDDKYHRPRWCPDGLSRSQKRRVQKLRTLEEVEAQYLEVLRKTRPDLATKIRYPREAEPRRHRKEWRPKQKEADEGASADVNMVFVLPAEFNAPSHEEAPVAQLDLGPRPVIFEKPQEKHYKHLKALYVRGHINGRPVGRMLVDTGAAVNIMPYAMLRRLGRSTEDLIKTNVTLNDFNGQPSETQGVLNVDLTMGRKTIPTTFFVVNSKGAYSVLLGRDWIHANCCIPSTLHQCLIQWDGDEVEVIPADDTVEVSLAGMSIWDLGDQEPLSGISLEGCERIEATKNGVRLVLSTGLTE
jgi:hypothetical protein